MLLFLKPSMDLFSDLRDSCESLSPYILNHAVLPEGNQIGYFF